MSAARLQATPPLQTSLLDTPSRFSDNAPPLISDMDYNLWLPPPYNKTLALGVCSILWGVKLTILEFSNVFSVFINLICQLVLLVKYGVHTSYNISLLFDTSKS